MELNQSVTGEIQPHLIFRYFAKLRPFLGESSHILLNRLYYNPPFDN